MLQDARQQRDRKVARRQGIGDGDDDVTGSSPARPVKVYECRVCGRRGNDNAYCPDCLAETMVEVAPVKPVK